MTMLPLRTGVSDTYPNPSNGVARTSFGQIWDVLNESFQSAEVDVASAATVDIGGQTSTRLRITGTTTITSLGTNYRGPIVARFASALTLTHNATTLILPGGANIAVKAGDVLIFSPKAASGVVNGWQLVSSAAVTTVANGVLYENSTTISANYTLTSGKNAHTVGPITIDTGVTLTVPSGQRLVVL